MQNAKLRPWKTLSKQTLLERGKYLTVENHEIELPDGDIIPDWSWVIGPDAVVILARTTEGKFLCFHQTKYAIQGTTLAPVGGLVDPGEKPLDAAKRELLEETGYTAPDWTPLGSYVMDPNRNVGTRYLYFAQNATKTAEPITDDLEDQHLLYLDREDLLSALKTAEFKILGWTALIALALHHLNGDI